MKIEESGHFSANKPPENVVELLAKPEVVAKLIPGVGKIEKAGDEYVGEAQVKLGHLSGKMTARFRYEAVRSDGVVVVGRATGLQTTADFRIEVSVKPSGSGSDVYWKFAGEARGLAASLAPGIVKSALKKMAEDAAINLAQFLSQ